MKTKIGQLNKRVTFQVPDDTDDGGGGKTREWVNGITVWASIVPTSSRERFEADRVENPTTHKITIRHTTNINPKYRISHNGRTFAIHGIIDIDEAGRFLEITAEENT